MWHTATFLMLLLTAVPDTTALADPTCPLPPGLAATASKDASGLLCNQGALGYWFPKDAARRLFGDLQAGAEAMRLNQILEGRLKIDDVVIDKLTLQLDTQTRISSELKRVTAEQALKLKGKDPWYKSQVLWFAVGFVSATVVGLGFACLYTSSC